MDEKLIKIYEKCTKLNFEPFDIPNYNYCDFLFRHFHLTREQHEVLMKRQYK